MFEAPFVVQNISLTINLNLNLNLNLNNVDNKFKSREKYEVNFARTKTYMFSAVPYLQRKLNTL